MAAYSRTGGPAADSARRPPAPAGLSQIGAACSGRRLVQGLRILQAVRQRRIPENGPDRAYETVRQGNRVRRNYCPSHRGKAVVSQGIYVISSTPTPSTNAIGTAERRTSGSGLLNR